MLNGHGDNGYLFKKKLKADFSSNVYYKGPNKGLLDFLSKSIHEIGNYPEVIGENINSLLAEKHQLNSSNILVTNGATEAFYLLAQLYKNQRSAIFIPSFSEYNDACKIHHHQIQYIDNSTEINDIPFNTDLVWLCNPNNPDGKIYNSNDIIQLCAKNTNTTFIIDEAYADFVSQNISVTKHVAILNNLIVVKSLTKKYTIPGLRIGYIVANNAIINKILSIKIPWSNNVIALNAVKYIFNNSENDFDLTELLSLSRNLQNELAKIKGIDVFPTETSFFLIKTKEKSDFIFDYLLNEHSILVRNASNFYGLDNHSIRVCAQSQDKNQLLIKACKQWSNN